MTRERIEDMREVVLPFVKKRLLETNYEGLGEADAKEFERDFNEILNLAIKALEQEPTTKNLAADREDAVERLNAIKQLIGYDKDSEIVKAMDMAIKALEQEPIKPTIESQPVIHANWLSGDCKGAHCSNCEEYTPFVYGAYNYCPNCGADMREAEE